MGPVTVCRVAVMQSSSAPPHKRHPSPPVCPRCYTWRTEDMHLAKSASCSIAAGILALAFCGHGEPALAQSAKPFLTLDGQAPLVIGHRGLPGLVPEETLASYDMAAALGADALEEDLHLTKDCVLVARHNPWLSDNTNIAEVAKTNPDVAARKRTVPGMRV